jgi:hypothetical protein
MIQTPKMTLLKSTVTLHFSESKWNNITIRMSDIDLRSKLKSVEKSGVCSTGQLDRLLMGYQINRPSENPRSALNIVQRTDIGTAINEANLN